MKTFGSHSSFGAQIAVNFATSTFPWLYGRMDIFLGGTKISKEWDDILLSDVLSLSDTWIDEKHNRRNKDLENTDTRRAFLSLETALYGNEHISWLLKNDSIIPTKSPLNYEICFGEVSDKAKIYAVELDHMIRIICSINNELPYETVISSQDFYCTLKSIKIHLEEEMQKIS